MHVRLSWRPPVGLRWAGLALILGVGCASGVLTTRLDQGVLCRDVRAGGIGEPLDPGPIFTTRDNRAVLWIHLEDLAGSHTLRYRWFDPTGTLSWDTGPVLVNEDGAYRREAAFSAALPIADAPAAMLPGRWTVRVDWDGEELLARELEIETR